MELKLFNEIDGLTTMNGATLIIAMNELIKKIPGTLFESGPYKGKSTAIYLPFDNIINSILIDINTDRIELDKLKNANKPINIYKMRSETFFEKNKKILSDNNIIHAHLDASHHFDNVKTELLHICKHMNKAGLICLDDFQNPFYQQVSAAYYYCKYVNKIDWIVILRGFNKAFLCHKSKFNEYAKFILTKLIPFLEMNTHKTYKLARTDDNNNSKCFYITENSNKETSEFYASSTFAGKYYVCK